MKIQNMAIIFLIIIIPLILVLSYYLHLQQKTLELQAAYDTKLADATKEGIKAFEVNTVDWSEWVSKKNNITKRNNANAVVNTFVSSLANQLNVTGTAKEFMINYIPAMAITMYDGYYIYAPTYVPITIENNEGVQIYYDKDSDSLTDVYKDGVEVIYEPQNVTGPNIKTASYVYINNEGVEITEPSISFVTDINLAKKEYKHILNNQIAYTARYSNGSNTNVVVNYTLDNRIYVYGKLNGESVEKDGYLVYFNTDSAMPRIYIPGYNVNNLNKQYHESDIKVDNKVTNTKYNSTSIETEILEEQVLYLENGQSNLKTFKYIYDIKHEKLYYDENADNFFTINPDDKTKQFISNDASIKIGSSGCRYKSLSVLWGDSNSTTEYKKIYQVLNGRDKGKWCISIKPENAKKPGQDEIIDTEIKLTKLQELGLDDIRFSTIYRDYSAISYYVEAYAFTNWARNLSGVKQEVYDEAQRKYIATPIQVEGGVKDIFVITETNDPEKRTSPITIHKREVMKNLINSNLNLSISNYGKGSYEFKLPVLTDSDWEQVFNNISLITFFQGVPIGLKYYNNYAIATSTTNREYVDPGELFFTGEDNNYHRVYCEKSKDVAYTGYRSVEYVLKEYENKNTGDITYYYQHDSINNNNSETACYYCVVNQANYKRTTDANINFTQAKAYKEALARERYYQKENVAGKLGVMITYHAGMEIGNEITSITGIPDAQEVEIGARAQILGQNPLPTITTNNQFIKYVFVGWSEDPISNNIKYYPGQVSDVIYEDTDLYAVWRISLSELNWTRDYKWNGDEYWDGGDHDVYDGSISNIRITEAAEGATVEMTGNSTLRGKGATWATFKSDFISIQEFQFTYHVNKGDSFNSVGFMFNVIDRGTYLEGYMFSINFTGNPRSVAGDTGAIFKFEYYKNKNSTNIEKLELPGPTGYTFHINVSQSRYSTTSGKMSIKVQDDGYLIEGTEMAGSCFIPVDNPQPDTFGFLSDHYSHGCNEIGYYKIDNIKIIAVRNK